MRLFYNGVLPKLSFYVTEAHRSAVHHLTSRVEIDEYDITVGYPEPLNLSAEALMKAGSEEPEEGGE